MQLVYILLIGIVVYYLVTRLFENYSTQEDFDPSLVPVSSIVTLAKVAQKLVDGGGTLTNPGNLTVTGNFTTKGQLIAGTPNISGGGMTVYGNLPWAHGGSQQTETSNSDGIQPYGVHFIHQNKSQGIGIGFDGIYKCGTNRDSTPDITLATTNHKGTVNIFGNINATGNLYLGNKTNSTGVYLYPDGTDGALSIRNTANTAVSSLRCGNITCGTINTNNNTITCGTINTNKNTITCGMVNSVEGLGGGGWLKTNNMLQISNIKDDNNNIQITCNDLNELKMITGQNQNYRAADINCGKITCNGSLTIGSTTINEDQLKKLLGFLNATTEFQLGHAWDTKHRLMLEIKGGKLLAGGEYNDQNGHISNWGETDRKSTFFKLLVKDN